MIRVPLSRHTATTLLGSIGVVAGIALSGCTAELKDLDPTSPTPPPIPASQPTAFLAKVDLRGGQVSIVSPILTGTALSRDDQPSLSLVGGDVVNLTSSNFSASAVGAFQPGKIRVSFDLAVTNRLDRVNLTGPTAFPAPPPGTTGPLLLPYDIAVATTSGGTSGSGGDVIVVLPSRGLVAPSPDWDGAPYSFFNDTDCSAPPTDGVSDCFRWEEFPGPIGSGATTAGRRVGFDIDPTVGQFTARILVGADLQDPTTPPPGSIQGMVNSTALGPLAGVTVVVNPGGLSANTDGAGSFQLANVPAGTVSLTVTGLPAACTTPPATPVLVVSGGMATLTVQVDCTAAPIFGSITGSVTDQLGNPLASVGVAATPSGQSATSPVTTDGAGAFSLTGVAVVSGSGILTLTSLPAACSDPGPIPYSGLTNGGVLTLGIQVSCP